MKESDTTTSKHQARVKPKAAEEDEPDDWDKRINDTGCAAENQKLQDCFFEKRDWRFCQNEMKSFRDCWKLQGNDQRTGTEDARHGDRK